MNKDKVFIINLQDEITGHVIKGESGYHVSYQNETYSSASLPKIMQDIAPAPTQKEALPDILAYYRMERYDVWEYLKRSNGFKTSRDIYFVSVPPGEKIWVPLRIPRDLTMFMNVGDTFTIMGDGTILVNRHRIIKLPPYLSSLIDMDTAVKGMTEIKGFVHDVRATDIFMGVRARIILDFPAKNMKSKALSE